MLRNDSLRNIVNITIPKSMVNGRSMISNMIGSLIFSSPKQHEVSGYGAKAY